jgi:hypothetical protein
MCRDASVVGQHNGRRDATVVGGVANVAA